MKDLPETDPTPLKSCGAMGIGQGHGTHEPGAAIKPIPEFVEQPMDLLSITRGITGGIKAGPAAQSLHFQSRIVR
jgi:hypothetical protein